ncbi:hypothetical protein H5410_014529 [Solanum commersonii]|uniref:Uncharacterized protein n=1 Tax=Solanum commersonii TaxID=4109 RepID=A0A9J5ZR64_SOLCO|nr:hypothetical protein H5410_014529 [Solanum commersonii]
MGNNPLESEVFERTYVKKKENESDTDVWVEKRVERTFVRGSIISTVYGRDSRNDVRRLMSGLEGIGSSCQAEALDGVSIAGMLAQIAKLTAALEESERRRVAEQKSMSATIQQIQEQVLNLARRPTATSSPAEGIDDDSEEEDDYIDCTP